MAHPTSNLPFLPLVGRSEDLRALGDAVEKLRVGEGSVIFVSGGGGVGKSRLLSALSELCRRKGWRVAAGRAYAVEAGVPFAIFSDALVPILSDLGDAALTVLTRGTKESLELLFPRLANRPLSEALGASEELDSRIQLFWSLSRVMEGLAERDPLLIALDDLHWSDPASLELLHFIARQIDHSPCVLVATINDDERGEHPTLATVERSLMSAGLLVPHRLEPLSRDAIEELVQETFGIGAPTSSRFAGLLRDRTGGNPLMIDATLSTLVEAGQLRREGGSWIGWEISEVDPPRSVRDALLARLERLTGAARIAAEAISVIGTRARHDTLRAVCDVSELELAAALEELQRHRIIEEEVMSGWPTYDFRHPMMREAVAGDLPMAKRALIHLRVAESLEATYGPSAAEHADELALHFSRGELGRLSPRAIPYLGTAGRHALTRFADREAAKYLKLALEGSETMGGGRWKIVEDLGRALHRLGDLDEAVRLWEGGVHEARSRNDDHFAATFLHRIGLAHFFAGKHGPAVAAYTEAVDAARKASDKGMLGRILGARGVCLQGLGKVDEAERDLREALTLAEASGDTALLARAHRSLLLFHTWSGPPEKARAHGEEAVALAEASGDHGIACTCRWAQAVLEGLTGRAAACVRHLKAAERLNLDLGSPLFRLAIAEVRVEYAFGVGEWDTAVASGEGAVALCRTLNQQALLSRLLVWTGLVHLGRAEDEWARDYFEEAWELSGAGMQDRLPDVHSVIPAHIGIASLHLALGDLEEAVRVATAGLAIVDGTGYRRWAVHRLLPVLAEAHLYAMDIEGARSVGERIRKEATELEDPLAHAWADACDALVLWRGGAGDEAASALCDAAERLEAIPYVPDALRVRRRLASCLADLGDREGAVHELRRIHDGFSKLGAARELDKTRRALREIGARPPTRASAPGAYGLTPRESEVLDLVASRKSNKAIARQLGISPRTVGTHLTRIFQKLDVQSRIELVEVARTLPRPGP